MVKKVRPAYTRERERIKKVYKRLELKGYVIEKEISLPTTKELVKQGINPEKYAKELKALKTKELKKQIMLVDPETGVMFNAGDIKEYEKEKQSQDNTASFTNYIYDEIDNIFLIHDLKDKRGNYYYKEDLESQIRNFKFTLLDYIEANISDNDYMSYLRDVKEEITKLIQDFNTITYYEELQDFMTELSKLILRRSLSKEESSAISDWGDTFNGESQY